MCIRDRARLEEKEATSTEDVEEILLEIEDKQLEPAEEVQQPDDEPEVIPQEPPPEMKQPEKPEQPGSTDIIQEMYKLLKRMEEDYRSMDKKIEDGQKSSKEDNRFLKEGQLSLIHI